MFTIYLYNLVYNDVMFYLKDIVLKSDFLQN